MRVALETLGCKLNQAETESLSRQFAERGCMVVNPQDAADIYVLNTCTVTHIADRKSRQCIRAASRLNPQALVVAVGCYADRDREALAGAGAGLVLGNREKAGLVSRLQEDGYLEDSLEMAVPCLRTRSMVAAQNGCNRYCSYCIVPYVRGRETSYPADMVVNAVKTRAAEGYKEVVLTGTEIGAYNDNGLDLKGLLERILLETDIERLRLSSLQPREIAPDLLALWRNRRLCPHFHISLQSGSDGVLERMKRGYTTAEYAQALNLVRSSVPQAAVTTDIITGFPGETEAEFAEGLAFCRSMGFARMHVFVYSRRSGTEAASMSGQVDERLKRERSHIMRELAKTAAAGFRSVFSGQVMDVLWEQRGTGGIWTGYTGNYIRVYSEDPEIEANLITPVNLAKPYRDGMWSKKRLPG